MISTTTPIRFKPFNENQPLRYYQSGHLPHLRQAGCSYFVTFRLADSIPAGRLKQWRQERSLRLKARGIDVQNSEWKLQFAKLCDRDRTIFERNCASKLFDALDEGWGDSCLRAAEVRKEVAGSLRYFDGSRYLLGDFVIMPNHVHAILTPLDGYELEEIMHSIKSWSSNQINRLLARSGSLWMKDTFDRLVRDGEELFRTQEYIRRNPVKAELNDDEYHLQAKTYVLNYQTV